MNILRFISGYWVSAIVNHLWQSTIVVLGGWLLTLVLRNVPARARFWIWMAASIKFLLPFSLLIAVGVSMHSFLRIPARQSRPLITILIQHATQPFPQTAALPATGFKTEDAQTRPLVFKQRILPLLLLVSWLSGVCIIAFIWLRQWWKVRASVRTAIPASIAADVPIVLTDGLSEPGVFGILRPVILLPANIPAHLSHLQLRAIIAHEMSHIRRRDNLTAVIHMVVTALFWFHPAVWWIKIRLLDEREQACDEAVLGSGNRAELYAESILIVCKFCLELPLVCVSGITGADLKRRIVRIMNGGNTVSSLGMYRKLMLATIGLIIIAIPILIGVMQTERARAEVVPASASAPRGSAQDNASSTLPHFAVASIRPVAPNEQGFISLSPYGLSRFTAKNISITSLVELAYNIDGAYIEGMPKKEDSTLFDIDAKPEGDVSLTYSRLQPYLQQLLQERFHLVVHQETKELSGYALIVAKNGFKLNPVNQPSSEGSILPDEIHIPSSSMEVLARTLASVVHRPVRDETEIHGNYNIQLKYAPEDAPDSPLPSIYTSLKEQLGLELRPQKVPVRILVVDHVDELPTEN